MAIQYRSIIFEESDSFEDPFSKDFGTDRLTNSWIHIASLKGTLLTANLETKHSFETLTSWTPTTSWITTTSQMIEGAESQLAKPSQADVA